MSQAPGNKAFTQRLGPYTFQIDRLGSSEGEVNWSVQTVQNRPSVLQPHHLSILARSSIDGISSEDLLTTSGYSTDFTAETGDGGCAVVKPGGSEAAGRVFVSAGDNRTVYYDEEAGDADANNETSIGVQTADGSSEVLTLNVVDSSGEIVYTLESDGEARSIGLSGPDWENSEYTITTGGNEQVTASPPIMVKSGNAEKPNSIPEFSFVSAETELFTEDITEVVSVDGDMCPGRSTSFSIPLANASLCKEIEGRIELENRLNGTTSVADFTVPTWDEGGGVNVDVDFEIPAESPTGEQRMFDLRIRSNADVNPDRDISETGNILEPGDLIVDNVSVDNEKCVGEKVQPQVRLRNQGDCPVGARLRVFNQASGDTITTDTTIVEGTETITPEIVVTEEAGRLGDFDVRMDIQRIEDGDWSTKTTRNFTVRTLSPNVDIIG